MDCLSLVSEQFDECGCLEQAFEWKWCDCRCAFRCGQPCACTQGEAEWRGAQHVALRTACRALEEAAMAVAGDDDSTYIDLGYDQVNKDGDLGGEGGALHPTADSTGLELYFDF